MKWWVGFEDWGLGLCLGSLAPVFLLSCFSFLSFNLGMGHFLGDYLGHGFMGMSLVLFYFSLLYLSLFFCSHFLFHPLRRLGAGPAYVGSFSFFFYVL